MATLIGGILNDPKIRQRIFSGIEKGPLITTKALVIHQTGAPTAQHTFNSYQQGGHGAHFLIDKHGIIYQTANLTRKTYHVGKIKSKCYETKACNKSQLQMITNILLQTGQSYSTSVKDLHNHEKNKAYPDRYPLNEDSIGVEIVGKFDVQKNTYEPVSLLQNQSLQWLIGELFNYFPISKADIYRHPEISYKMPSEAGTARW